MQDSVAEIEKFLYAYPNTRYRPLIETMLTKFNLAIYQLNAQIAELYKKTGREESANIYEQKVETSPLNDANVISPELPWYRKLFE